MNPSVALSNREALPGFEFIRAEVEVREIVTKLWFSVAVCWNSPLLKAFSQNSLSSLGAFPSLCRTKLNWVWVQITPGSGILKFKCSSWCSEPKQGGKKVGGCNYNDKVISLHAVVPAVSKWRESWSGLSDWLWEGFYSAFIIIFSGEVTTSRGREASLNPSGRVKNT